MPVLNPWLQRLLVGLLGGTTTGTVLVATAKNRHAPKKAKKKRPPELDDDGNPIPRVSKPKPPIALGTVAKHDAAEAFVPSMTWAEWGAGVQARSRRLVDALFGGKKRSVDAAFDENGARVADEVVTADGQRVKKPAAKKKTAKKGTKQAAQRGRRRRRRQQATLFDSAKESLRQVVKEEVKKTVDDTVEQTGLKGAVDTIKQASDNVGETARDVATKIKEALPPDAGEKLQSGARSLFAGAKKQAARWRDSVKEALEAADRTNELNERNALDVNPPPEASLPAPAEPDDAPPSAPVIIDVVDGEPDLQGDGSTALAPRAATDGALTTTNTASPPSAPSPPSETPREGLSAEDIADKVNEGVSRLGSFLVGPGHPDYGSQRRRRVANGDVVEARDPPPAPGQADDDDGLR